MWAISEFADIADACEDLEKTTYRQRTFEIGAMFYVFFIFVSLNGGMNVVIALKETTPFLKACAKLNGSEIRGIFMKARRMREASAYEGFLRCLKNDS